MAVRDLFSSASVPEHLARGTIGIAAYFGAGYFFMLPSVAALLPAVALAIVSLAVMRGCPVCWSIGLFNTTRNQVCPIPIAPKK